MNTLTTNKQGEASGSAVVWIVRIFLYVVATAALLLTSSLAYGYEIHVRDAEAILMGRQLLDCLAPQGTINWDTYEGQTIKPLTYCNTGGNNKERFFVRIKITNPVTNKELNFHEGDSGALWVNQIFSSSNKEQIGSIQTYEPGYYSNTYQVQVQSQGINQGIGTITLEVLVQDERTN